jgi:hypothetical protein
MRRTVVSQFSCPSHAGRCVLRWVGDREQFLCSGQDAAGAQDTGDLRGDGLVAVGRAPAFITVAQFMTVGDGSAEIAQGRLLVDVTTTCDRVEVTGRADDFG